MRVHGRILGFIVAAACLGSGCYTPSLVATFDVPLSNVHAAAKQALGDLELKVETDNVDKLTGKLTSHFADGKELVVKLRRKQDLTEVKVYVGFMGHEERQNQVLAAIKKRVQTP